MVGKYFWSHTKNKKDKHISFIVLWEQQTEFSAINSFCILMLILLYNVKIPKLLNQNYTNQFKSNTRKKTQLIKDRETNK